MATKKIKSRTTPIFNVNRRIRHTRLSQIRSSSPLGSVLGTPSTAVSMRVLSSIHSYLLLEWGYYEKVSFNGLLLLLLLKLCIILHLQGFYLNT
jgi:hypothetical protein